VAPTKPKAPDAPTRDVHDEPNEKVGDAPHDTMLIHGISEDGDSLAVLRARDDRIEAGVVRKVKDGEPLHGELVKLTPRAEMPLVCDVEVQMRSPFADAAKGATKELSHGGPAQVATERYRDNWDAIWSAKKNQSSTLN